MKREKFENYKEACYAFTAVTVKGVRQQRDEAERMLADLVRRDARAKPESAAYAVGIVTENHGTRNYPDICHEVALFPVDSMMKNGNGYRYGGHILRNGDVIGWLTK